MIRNLGILFVVLFAVPSVSAAEGLDDSVMSSIGDVLLVRTAYGWGWSKDDESDPSALSNFHIQVVSFWEFQRKRRGGIAKIVEPNHPADGMWLVFSTRHAGHYDFRENVAYYNLDIGEGKPTARENGWPKLGSGAKYMGYGQISYELSQ